MENGLSPAFHLPAANGNMRRVFAYLIKQRYIDPAVITHFAHERTLYESREFFGEPKREIHNAVFVGKDKDGIPRHAHKRSLNSYGAGYKGNTDGSNPAYSFCHIGTSSWLFVFEAPIDLLSYLTLYPDNWQEHSYVALCGVAEHAMLGRLQEYPHLHTVILCMDNDVAGLNATERLTDILWDYGYMDIWQGRSRCKDWNEDLIALHGGTPKPAVPHVYRNLFMESLDAMQCRHCSNLERTRARIWTFYKDYSQTGDLESVRRTAETAATGVGLIRARLGVSADCVDGFDGFRREYRAGYRAYRDKSLVTSRQTAFERAVRVVMTDLGEHAARSPEDYRVTADKLTTLFDASAKLYARLRMEQLEDQAFEQRQEYQK